jgi:hypothetical protein
VLRQLIGWQHVTAETAELYTTIAEITADVAPALLAPFGVGLDVAAVLLITASGNTDRMHHESSFAAFCGVSPIAGVFGQGQSPSTQPRRRPASRNVARYPTRPQC